MSAPVIVRHGNGGNRRFVVRDRGVSYVMRWEVSEQIGTSQFSNHAQFRLLSLAEREWWNRINAAGAEWQRAVDAHFAAKRASLYERPLSAADEYRAEHPTSLSCMPDHHSS